MVKPRPPPPANEQLDCDVCIVGAGAAGLSLALDFIGLPQKMLVIDAGDLHGKRTDQSFYEGEVVNPAHPAPNMYRHRRLGGSTTIWGGRCVPYDEIDFEARDYVALSGWPFRRAELEPYYIRAQAILEAGAFDYVARSALRGGALIDDFDDPDVLTQSLERYSLPTNFWRDYRHRIAAAPNVQVVGGATAVRLERGDAGRIETLSCVDGQGSFFTIRARVFVIASGALETVRILGFSNLGNDADMLGRTYMCHVESSVGEIRLTPKGRGITYGFEKTIDGVYTRRRFTLSPARQRSLKVMNAAARPHHPPVGDPAHGHPVLSAMFLAKRFIIPEYARRFAAAERLAGGGSSRSAGFLAHHIRNLILGSPRLLGFTVDWTYRRYLSRRRLPYVSLPSAAGMFPLDFNGEQEPNPTSRVTLTDKLDRNGVPRLLIDWRLTELDYRTLTTTLREIRAALRRAGCGDIAFDDARLDDEVRSKVRPVGGHHIGTARMSTDPSQGVVDADCRVHGVDNLYLAGAATFPTSGQANPTLTIVAMALRLGTHLRARLEAGAGGL